MQVGIVAAAALMGVGTGVAVAFFKSLIKSFREFVYEGAYSDLVHDISTALTKLTGFVPVSSYNPEYILFPLIGGVIVSIILALEGNDLGPGVKGIVKEVDEDKNINLRKFGVKASAAVATLGSGLSLGPEGPSVELGAGVSRIISEAVRKSQHAQHANQPICRPSNLATDQPTGLPTCQLANHPSPLSASNQRQPISSLASLPPPSADGKTPPLLVFATRSSASRATSSK